MLKLKYEKGTIRVTGDVRLPHTRWDDRTNTFRAPAYHYRDMVDYLEGSGIEYADQVLELAPCPLIPPIAQSMRVYQQEALDVWKRDMKGVVVLPTGSGKTIVGAAAISVVNAPTLVVVPTLDLVDQWRQVLQETFRFDIGVFSGNEKKLEPVTVSTYDSAYLNAENLGNRFSLLVFDEIHHLPAPGYIQIAEAFASPYRLGLTATYEREDGLHEELPRVVGGKVYEKKVDELTGKYLANYVHKKVFTDLTEGEQREYDELHGNFTRFLRSRKIRLSGPEDFRKLVMRSGRDGKAREALLSRQKARAIAYNSSSKLEAVKEIFAAHPEERTLIFTEFNDLVHTISRRFLIPSITYRTQTKERSETLLKFRNGTYRILVTSKVLDEGVDVPEASVGVILSGSGSSREFVQRLGRLLRRKEGKKAVLYEVVSRKTSEMATSRRRKKQDDSE